MKLHFKLALGAIATLSTLDVTRGQCTCPPNPSCDGGQFSLSMGSWRGADPALYPHLMPSGQPSVFGRAAAPLPGAAHATGVPSLQPSDLFLGQIVAFDLRFTVGRSAPESCVNVVVSFETNTTSGCRFGFDPFVVPSAGTPGPFAGATGIYGAFVDTSESVESMSADATVCDVQTALVGTEIRASVTVANVSPKDEIVIEIWTVLQDSTNGCFTGNVQTNVVEASVVENGMNCDTINVGNQTVPLSLGGPDGDFPPFNYCIGNPNSTTGYTPGTGGSIGYSGSQSISTNDLVLTAGGIPNTIGLFFWGRSMAEPPYGTLGAGTRAPMGTMCVQGEMQRLCIVMASNNQAQCRANFDVFPWNGIAPGDALYFQYWYRDQAQFPLPGSDGQGSNGTDALCFPFLP